MNLVQKDANAQDSLQKRQGPNAATLTWRYPSNLDLSRHPKRSEIPLKGAGSVDWGRICAQVAQLSITLGVNWCDLVAGLHKRHLHSNGFLRTRIRRVIYPAC
jgi:hypothetical protein